MSKNSKKRSAAENAKAGTKADEQKMSAADTAKAVSENVLEDMLGIGSPSSPTRRWSLRLRRTAGACCCRAWAC